MKSCDLICFLFKTDTQKALLYASLLPESFLLRVVPPFLAQSFYLAITSIEPALIHLPDLRSKRSTSFPSIANFFFSPIW